jgi:hypothetical protein
LPTSASSPVDVAIRAAIAQYRYHIQARHHCDGYAAFFRLARLGHVFGKCPLATNWHRRIVAPDDLRWTSIFTRRTAHRSARVGTFPR